MTSGGKRKRRILFAMTMLLVLTGCSGKQIVDHVHILIMLGLDKSGAGFKETGLYANYNQGGKTALLQGNVTKPSMMLDELNKQSTMPVMIAKLKFLMIDKQLAEEGIAPFIESICRDPLISHYLVVAVTEGSTADMMESLANATSESLPFHTVEHNIRSGAIPESNLHTLLFDYYGPGIDASVPYLKINSNGKIAIAGHAVFKKDRLKLVIAPDEVALYNMLQGRLVRGNIPFAVPSGQNEGTAVFTSLNGKKSRRVSTSASGTKIAYTISLTGMIKDYPKGTERRNPGSNPLMVMQLEKQLQGKLSALLGKFVQNKVDPLGIGDLVRAHRRSWSEKEFYEVEYPSIDFEIHVKVNLIKSGIVE